MHHSPFVRTGIKGIGRYTAGAVASICGGVAAPIVDGNVLRVASRLHAVAASAKEPSYCADGKLSWSLARQLVEAGGGARPGELNQASSADPNPDTHPDPEPNPEPNSKPKPTPRPRHAPTPTPTPKLKPSPHPKACPHPHPKPNPHPPKPQPQTPAP